MLYVNEYNWFSSGLSLFLMFTIQLISIVMVERTLKPEHQIQWRTFLARNGINLLLVALVLTAGIGPFYWSVDSSDETSVDNEDIELIYNDQISTASDVEDQTVAEEKEVSEKKLHSFKQSTTVAEVKDVSKQKAKAESDAFWETTIVEGSADGFYNTPAEDVQLPI